MEQTGVLHRVEIGPLPVEAVRELTEEVIGAAAEPELIDWLNSRAKANPLFVLGLLQALVEEGGDLSRPALRSLPEGLAERVRVRMRRLDGRQREIIELLAVAGGRVELGDVVVLCDRPLEELGPSLQALVRSRFVAEAQRGRTYSYEISHPLVQETVYASLLSATRTSLHRVAGDALETMTDLAPGQWTPVTFRLTPTVQCPQPAPVQASIGTIEDGVRIDREVGVLPDLGWVKVAGCPT